MFKPTRLAAVVVVFTGLLSSAHAATLVEAPVTITMTISVTGPETQKTGKGGAIDLQAKLLTFRYTNRDYIESLVADGVVNTASGWRLVARWHAGEDSPEAYRFYLVKSGKSPVELDGENGINLGFGALAAGYSERWAGSNAVSGSGNVKFASSLITKVDGDHFQLFGLTTGSYSIKPLTKGGQPLLAFNSLSFVLKGMVSAEDADLEGVAEMTLTLGKPVVISVTSGGTLGGSVSMTDNVTITPPVSAIGHLTLSGNSLLKVGAGATEPMVLPFAPGEFTLADGVLLITAPTN